ncbi:MAG: glycerophosphodiester phosphodiesterase [Pigmentiphaga sp.]
MAWPYPRIIAHRGGGVLAPENTLAGFATASRLGHRGVEFDVMLTRDGVPVVMHDDRLGRTVPGRGSIAALSYAELRTLDAGSWFDARFAAERVPTLAQALDMLAAAGVWMNIEIKPVPGHDAVTGEAVALAVADFWATRGVGLAPLLSSFSVPALQAAQQAAPSLARALLVESVPADWRARLDALQAVALHVQHKDLSAYLVDRLRAEGHGVMAYTVNDPGRARQLLAWGVDAICTDRLDLLTPDFA